MDLSTMQTNPTIAHQTRKKTQSLTLQTLKPKHSTNSNSTILADISGSMYGEPLEQLKKALKKVWRPGITGIAFNSQIYSFEEQDIPTLPATGSTDMIGALYEGWKSESGHMILITDGHPDGGPSEVMKEVSKHPTPPIDTIGVGINYAKDLLQQIADFTGGKFMDVSQPLLLTQTLELLLLTDHSTNGGSIKL